MQDRFIKQINQLPASLAAGLVPLLNQHFSGHLDAQQVADLISISGLEKSELMFQLLTIAKQISLAPVSHFHVGAIAEGNSGDIYMGANVELQGRALCHSVHAEQHAISHAWLNGETGIRNIWINASPCGHCRQFINEIDGGAAINIYLPNTVVKTVSEYLPNAFGPADLGVAEPLMHKQQHTLYCDDQSDPLIIEALDHASLSYAPYSKNHSAVVLELIDGQTFSGRYAENAAFNPSMMPMQMAIASLLRHNHGFEEIQRAVLLESSAGALSLIDISSDALQAISAVPLEHIVAEAI
ncbi:cytidine deaminase [Shewanella mangrovi]|uniref:Cytidine deaminase n=1 Tax=Shewanella mangrovi TaxID=1515746 RepID=A0A094JKS5_9GAMM|nr:cytidine deaminase [Shewanella mangrovi]KFZ38659.1 cytidine deaminase [Shewanella mangrovi]